MLVSLVQSRLKIFTPVSTECNGWEKTMLHEARNVSIQRTRRTYTVTDPSVWVNIRVLDLSDKPSFGCERRESLVSM